VRTVRKIACITPHPVRSRCTSRAAERGAHLGVLTRGLLALLDTHGGSALAAAIAATLAEDAAHLGAVRHCIDQHAHARGQAPPIAVVLPKDPHPRRPRTSRLRRLASACDSSVSTACSLRPKR